MTLYDLLRDVCAATAVTRPQSKHLEGPARSIYSRGPS